MAAYETTEHRTMNTIVHAAFRRDLARFDAALAAFPDGDQRRADELGRAWDLYAPRRLGAWPGLRQPVHPSSTRPAGLMTACGTRRARSFERRSASTPLRLTT